MKSPFRVDRNMLEVLKESNFTFSAEILPPRNGVSQDKILGEINNLVESGVQFLSVTKGAGGSLRAGSLPIAQVVKDHFDRPVIAHFTCRDLNPEEVENQLLDHHYFGVRNVLALRGDPPSDQPDWRPKEGSYEFAYQLIDQIRRLNNGEFLKRSSSQSESQRQATQFCIGAAAYPDDPEVSQRVTFLKRKIEAGAQYGITQMVYSVESYRRLAEKFPHFPILPGFRILKSKEQALRVQTRFQVPIPQHIIDALPNESDWKDPSLSTACQSRVLNVLEELVRQLKSSGAPGIHLFVLSEFDLTCQSIKHLLKVI